VAALLTTPLLWMHYLLLLFVPIAFYRPRLSGSGSCRCCSG
jgi:hypothetical protein